MCEPLGMVSESADLFFVQLSSSMELTKNTTVYAEMHLGEIQVRYHFYVVDN